jgi:hypothetical protein
LGAIQAVAPSFGVELSAGGLRDAGEIERTVAAFAGSSNAGLIVTASTSGALHRDLITMLAARHRLRRLASSLCASAARASGKVVGRPGRSTPVRTARNTLSVIDRTFSGVSVKCVKLGREMIADLAAKLATSTGAVSPEAWPKLYGAYLDQVEDRG